MKTIYRFGRCLVIAALLLGSGAARGDGAAATGGNGSSGATRRSTRHAGRSGGHRPG